MADGTSNDLAKLLPPGLTNEEAEFVYSVEVLGMPVRTAAARCGMPLGLASKPHIIQARELTKREIRNAMQLTKEDISFGMRDAIDRARIMGEPMTEIVGWEKLAKLHGFDSPTKVDVNIHASVEVLRTNIRAMSDDELVKALGANGIIDAEFYEVDEGK